MAGLRGELYGIRIGQDYLPCEIDCEITITTDMIEKSGSHGGRYKHFRAGYINWAISANARLVLGLLQSNSNALLEAQRNGLELEVFISARQSNTNTFDIGGTVLISSQQLSFGNRGFASHNLTMQGTGELGLSYEEIALIINSNPSTADYPLVYNSNY